MFMGLNIETFGALAHQPQFNSRIDEGKYCASVKFAPAKKALWSKNNGSTHLCDLDQSFFIFYIVYFTIFQKHIPQFFFQIWPPVASSTGSKGIPPDEPAIGVL